MIRNKQLKTIYICSIILILVSVAVFAIQYIHDREINYPTGLPSDLNFVKYYEIASTAILSDLNLGKTPVFKPIDISANTINTPDSLGSFSWSQSDYLIVANALNQIMSNDSNDWKIYGMIFYRNCQDESVGFDSADITYFMYSSQQDNYLIHQISIYPSAGIVSFGEGGFRRPLFGWKSINLSRLSVSADVALQKAEENGGEEFRTKLNNVCNILLVVKPNHDDNHWLVSYSANSNSDTFRIYIDPYTGWYKITNKSR